LGSRVRIPSPAPIKPKQFQDISARGTKPRGRFDTEHNAKDRAWPGRAARQGGSAGSPRPSAGCPDSRSAGRDTTASDQAQIVSHSPWSATNIFAVNIIEVKGLAVRRGLRTPLQGVCTSFAECDLRGVVNQTRKPQITAKTAAATQSATAQNGGYHNGMGANLEPKFQIPCMT